MQSLQNALQDAEKAEQSARARLDAAGLLGPSQGRAPGSKEDHAEGPAERVRDVLNNLPESDRATVRAGLRRFLFRRSPEIWARHALGIDLDPWQRRLVSAPPGARAIALVHRQAGKTTGAGVAVAHTMIFGPAGTTSLVLAPTQRQSGEAIRRIRGFLLKGGAKLDGDNAFSLTLPLGSRVLAMPGADDAAIRGLTVDGALVIDEAARVSDALYDAARPMLLRHAQQARLFLLSTAWAKQGFFYRVWAEGDPRDWIKIEAAIHECSHLTPEDVERERRTMPAAVFEREYLNQFDSLETRFFNMDAVQAALGAVAAPTPAFEAGERGADPDPVVAAVPAFGAAMFGRR